MFIDTIGCSTVLRTAVKALPKMKKKIALFASQVQVQVQVYSNQIKHKQ